MKILTKVFLQIFFDDLIREIICLISLADFLLVCQLFEHKKELRLSDYIEAISAVSKTVQSSRSKTELIVNFFKKLDKNNIYKRLLDTY